MEGSLLYVGGLLVRSNVDLVERAARLVAELQRLALAPVRRALLGLGCSDPPGGGVA